MKTIVSRVLISLLFLSCLGAVATAQQAAPGAASSNYLQQVGAPPAPAPAPDPVITSTGQGYWGFDVGLTYSSYPGASNFFWPAFDADYSIRTPLQFDNLGSGLGGIFGFKAGFPLSSSIDLEGKLRYLTNSSSATETHNLFVSNTGGTGPATSNYTLLLSNLDLAAVLHFALSDAWYAVGGLSFSDLLSNRYSDVQTLGPNLQYNDINGNATGVTQVFATSESLSGVFNSSRLDVQLGAGTIIPMSSNSFAIDAELLVGIPLTSWLQSSEQASFDQFADSYNAPMLAAGEPATLSHPTIPNLWYASLTIGIRFPFSHAEPEANSSSEVPTSQQAIGDDGKVALTGTVTDAKTGDPVDANMTVVDLTNNQVVATDRTHDGKYNVRVKAPGRYSVTADADGYLFGTAYFQVDDQGRILSRHEDIKLSNASGGRTRLLVFFNTGSAELNASSYPELDRAVRLMKAVPAMRVEIAGYTDSVGSDEFNLDLSQKRANEVRDYIVHNGIPKSRVTAHGYGKQSPIADNGTDEGRSENRRVEFVVLSK